MKIEEKTQVTIAGVSDWVRSISDLPHEDFLRELQTFEKWSFQRIDDLSAISPVLDRIDELLTEGIASEGFPLLKFLLDKTILLLQPATSKALYNSVHSLVQILSFDEWAVVYKALQVLHLLVNRVTPVIKQTKAHTNSDLTHKLYVIGLGTNLNCSSPMSLQDQCSRSAMKKNLDFQYVKGEDLVTSFKDIPAELDYVLLNRKRTNKALSGTKFEREIMVASQLLALSCLMQIPPESQTLQDFCRSLPELWLLPSVSELLRMDVNAEVHVQCINVLSGILVMLEAQNTRHDLTHNHLITSTHNLLAAWQQHGLMQTLLRDISHSPTLLPKETTVNNSFIWALLHLSSIVADYKYRVDSSHVPGMTCSLLLLLQNNKELTLTNTSKAVRILSVVVSHSIDMFKEIGGLDTVLDLLSNEFKLYNSQPDPSRAYLIRAFLRLLKIALTKWDPSHTIAHSEVRHILDSSLLASLRKTFELRNFDVYEPSLQLICSFLNDYQPLVSELVEDGTIHTLLVSLENKLPNNPKLIGIITKFLCVVSLNADGCNLIEKFSTSVWLLQALGNTEGSALSSDLAASIAENLRDIMTNVPLIVGKMVDGCIELIRSLLVCNTFSREIFFTQLTNVGKLMSVLFGFSEKLVKGFIDKGGFEMVLKIFQLPVRPLTYSNEFHGVLQCFKSIPVNLTGLVLVKILESLNTQLDLLESHIGTLAETIDLRHISDNSELIYVLTATDSYVEMLRLVLQYSSGSATNIDDLCLILQRLCHYMRILIAEQARISPFSKPNQRTTTTFNQPIDISDIENAAMKSFDENFYFTCQLSVRKLYRFAAKMTAARGRLAVPEEAGVKMSKNMGEILAYLIKLIDLESPDQSKAYFFCLLLSDILKILLQDQGSNPATIFTFSQCGGTDHIYKFLVQLSQISKKMNNASEKPYDLVNSLQILWNLCGKSLECLAVNKLGSTSTGNAVLKGLGCDNPKEVNKRMQKIALDCIAGLNYLECGLYSTAFAKSALEILKNFADLGKISENNNIKMNDFEFTEQELFQASRATNSSDVEVIKLYLKSNREVMPVEEEIHIDDLHCILINSLPAIPNLRSNIAEILIKACSKPKSPYIEIAKMLLLECGLLVNHLLGEPCLLLAMQGETSVTMIEVVPSFEQLGACLSVLSSLASKSEGILEVIHAHKFTTHAIQIMEALNSDLEPAALSSLSPLFSLLDSLCKLDDATDNRLMLAICNLINNHKNIQCPEQPDLHSLLQLLITLTLNPDHAKIFIDSKAFNLMLTLKVNDTEEKLKTNLSFYGILLRQLVEDPYILQSSFELAILQGIKTDIELKDLLHGLSLQIKRSREIFKLAFENNCKIVSKNGKFLVELHKDRKEIVSEKWKTVNVICLSLCEVFEGEQKGTEYMIPSQNLVAILSEIFQFYPILIKDVIGLSLKSSKKFLTYLIRNIIPFRYSLQLSEGKVLFTYPNSDMPVTPEIYQNWVKMTSKLIKSLTFKQAYKHQDAKISEIYSTLILDNNSPTQKARKRVFRELKEMLLEQSKKQWFGNEKSMAIVRAVVIIIMNSLRESSKSPFTSNNSAEIARMLVSDQINMVKLLSDSAKGVKINFKKAGSMLNLILAPLELLTRYNLNFTLHLSKPLADQEMEEIIEDPVDENLDKFDLLEAEEVYDEEDDNSSSEEVQLGREEEMEGEDLDDESEEPIEIEQEANEEEDDEDLLEESEPIEENLENIVIEGHNTEAFWADELAEENDPASNVWIQNRQSDESSVERHIVEHRFQIEADEVWPGRDMPRRWDIVETEDSGQIINLFRDIETADNDLLQLLLRGRNRVELPEGLRHDDSKAVIEMFESLTKDSCVLDEPMHIENESLDPLFLAALPSDIRCELLQQHESEHFVKGEEFETRPRPSEEMDNATFIASLTPDLRREVLLTANEEVIASLTPELAAEARILQERVISRRHGQMERQAPARHLDHDEGKIIAEIVSDEKLSTSLIHVEDSFLEVLVKGIYLLNPINRDILASLLLNLSAQPNLRGKILDALTCLLIQFSPDKDFPPQRLYGSETYIENYSQVYAIVAGRVLDLLLYMAQKNPKVSGDFLSPFKARLHLIKSLRGNEEIKGFSQLLNLTQHKLFETSSTHLNPLINLISCLIEKQENEVPTLNELEILQICAILKYESLSEISVKTVIELVARLAHNPDNKNQIESYLFNIFAVLGPEISQNLQVLETSSDGQTELQLLRYFKVYKMVSNNSGGLECIWGPLTEALNSITKRDSDFASTANPTLSKLLPVIETFFISHIGASQNDNFQKFCDKNRRVLNILVKQNPLILQDTFHSLVSEFPALLDFENKRSYFRSEIRKLRPDKNSDSIRLQVRRSEVFLDSFHQLKTRTPSEMHGKLRVQFLEEDGVDAGGLTREWYELLAREMFNPNYALFIPSANGVSFQPNCMSSINVEHLDYFKFIGRIIGKALCDGYALDVYFTRSFYKHILGQEVTYHDMEDLDPDFYKNLRSLMDINLDDNELHEYYFAYEEEEFGTLQIKELVPGGTNKRVTEENKMEYIKLLCDMKMTQNIMSQISSFLEGFHELVPKPMIAIFDSKELELLISGLPEIDIDDLRSNTEYHNYTKDSQVIKWLWEVMQEFSQEERAEFLQFVTGSSKVPLEGFKALPGMSGVQKFQIHKSFTGSDRLPTAHTCMNQLDLPEYPSKDVLRVRLKLAITEGKEGFGFM